jgi:hypothetical protein
LYREKFKKYEGSAALRILGNYKIHSSELARLSAKYGTDKGGPYTPEENYEHFYHTYTDLYELFFSNCRDSVRLIFECGIGSNDSSISGNFRFWNEQITDNLKTENVHAPGASLRMWEEYFPNAQIFGADIDSSCLFQEGRIKTFQLDQTVSDSVKNFWDSVGLFNFDIMIDDGLHEFEAGKCLFENSIARLKVGGYYIIEDVLLSDLISYQDFFQAKPYNVFQFSMQRTSLGLESINHNSVVLIRKLS